MKYYIVYWNLFIFIITCLTNPFTITKALFRTQLLSKENYRYLDGIRKKIKTKYFLIYKLTLTVTRAFYNLLFLNPGLAEPWPLDDCRLTERVDTSASSLLSNSYFSLRCTDYGQLFSERKAYRIKWRGF